MATDIAPQIPAADDESTVLLAPEWIDLLRVGLLGAAVGLLVPALGWLLQQFLISPIFCHGTTSLAVCATGDVTTYDVSAVVMGVIAVALMANWQIFRPLLIAVAAAASLWGFQHYVGDTVSHAGAEYYLSSVILYALAFVLFYWLLRLKNFALSVILTVLAVILIRWALLV